MPVYFLIAIAVDKPPFTLDDVTTRQVVAALDEPRARRRAAVQAGQEGYDTWLDPKLVRCEAIDPSVERAVMSDAYEYDDS